MTDPAAESQPIMLGDGTQHSRYRRFFTPVKQVSTQQLTYLTSVDDDEHEALAAVDPTTGQGVAVARHVVVGDAPSTAEVALTVLDEWQGRGVGRALLRRLAALALGRGILRFSGLMLAANSTMIALMRSLGPVVSTRRENGTLELVVELDPDAIR